MHQCVSEDAWFKNMLGIDVAAPPLPKEESRLAFMKRYAEDSAKRLNALRQKVDLWWEEDTKFFDVWRSRAWVMTRRLTHTSHLSRACLRRCPSLMLRRASTLALWPRSLRLIASPTSGGRGLPRVSHA